MRKEQLDGDDIFLIHNFFSPEECAAAIARAEKVGFEEAPITTASGPVMRKDVRDNTRVMIDDVKEAAWICERARPFLPAVLKNRWHLSGFNERWRYYRYDPGERFAPHYDGHFARSADEVSQLTFMIYLNDDFAGGETNFYFLSEEPAITVRPVTGMALVFVHWKLHEGAAILRGRKYVQRTDVMYRRKEANAS